MKGKGFPDATHRIVCSDPMSTWVLLIVSAHSGAATKTHTDSRSGWLRNKPFKATLTLHIEPGLVPVLPFGVDRLTLVPAHVFILHVVQVKHGS